MSHLESRLKRIEAMLEAAAKSAEPTLAELVQAAYAINGAPITKAAPTIRVEPRRSLSELILTAGQSTPNNAEESA